MKKLLSLLLLTTAAFAQNSSINGVGAQNVTASHPYVAGGGSANAQTAAYSPAVTSLKAGLELCWLPTAANTTTTPTFAPNGLTAATITKTGTGALAASDLTTTAVACAIYDGTEWQLQNPQTATGGGGGGSGSLVLLGEYTASSSATLNIVSRNVTGQSGAIFQSDYDVYRMDVVNLLPATNNVKLQMVVSTNGGSTWDTASDYTYADFRWASSSGTGVQGSVSTTSMIFAAPDGSMSNTAANGGYAGSLTFYTPLNTTGRKYFRGAGAYFDSTGTEIGNSSSGSYTPTTAMNAVQISSTSGNLTSGTVRIYGVAK